MLDKIVWLLIVGTVLGAPLQDDLTQKDDQRPRSSRSIWPFTSGNTEPPVHTDENFFLSEDTGLPEGIDLNRYPLWKIHKYQGIDLKPVQVQQVAPYPPESVAVDASRFDASSDGRQTSYQTGYNNFVESKIVTHQDTQGGPYPPETENSAKEAAPYPPQVEAVYPPETPSFQNGEFQSSDYWNTENSRQKFTGYALPVEDTPPAVPHSTYGVPGYPPPVEDTRPVVPHSTYGVPEAYQAPNFAHQQSSGFQEQQDSDSKPDLSFLDNLGGLAPFLPEPEGQTEAPSGGFLQSLISRIRGATETPAIAEEAVTEEPAQSGGFLSSIFGSSQSTGQTSSSGGSILSSLFYKRDEPAPAPAQEPLPPPVPATTYYLPETKGSYVAVKLPPGVQSGFVPNLGPHVGTIPFHEAPKVSFVPDAIPQISAATAFRGTQERNAASHTAASAQQIYHTDVKFPNAQESTVHSAASQAYEAPSESSDISQISNYSPSAAYQVHLSSSNEERNANYQQRQNSQTVHVDSQLLVAAQPTRSNSETSVRTDGGNSEKHESHHNSQSQSSFLINHQERREPVDYQQQIPRDTGSYQEPTPIYQISPSAYRAPINPPGPIEHYDNLPVHTAVNFRDTSFQQDNRNQVEKQQLSSLTSYGTPTLSYHDEPFLASPSDMSEVIVETDPVSIIEPPNQDGAPLAKEELPKESETATKDSTAEETKLKGKIRRRSSPERQAPAEDERSSVYRTQVDLVPDVREGRHYEGTMITNGYSKVKQIIPTSTS